MSVLTMSIVKSPLMKEKLGIPDMPKAKKTSSGNEKFVAKMKRRECRLQIKIALCGVMEFASG